jgi:hypothetical protein
MGELPNPMNQLAQVSQIQNAQNQNALAQYQLSSAQRADEQQRNLYAAAQQPGFKLDFTTAVQYGAPGMAAFKTQQEAQAAGLTQEKLRGEILAQTPKLQNDVSEQFKKQLTNVNDYNSAVNWLDKQYKHPVLGPLMAQMPFEEAVRQIPQDPTKFQEWKNKNALGIEKYIEQNKPTTNVVNRSGQADIVQTPGLDGVPITVGTYADVPLPAAVEAQKARIALAGRAPVQPRAEQPLEKVVDPATGKIVFASREDALRNKMTPAAAMEGLAPKEIQKREAALPQARQSVKTISNTMSVIGQTVDSLLANPDGIDGITGLVYGVTPAITGPARKAKAELDQLKNLAFIQGITELREASKTGAAVGNVTNREGDRFENLKASLDRSQSKEDLVAALKKLKTQAELTSQFTTEAFDDTYSYKSAAPAAPAAGQGTGGFKYLGKENK